MHSTSRLHGPVGATKIQGKIRENFWQKCYIATKVLGFIFFMEPSFAIIGPLGMLLISLIKNRWVSVKPERIAYLREKAA
jgi:hypothetical protein